MDDVGGKSIESGSDHGSLLEIHNANGQTTQQSHLYDESQYRMHRYAYEDDLKSLTALIVSRDKSLDFTLKDMHGKTC